MPGQDHESCVPTRSSRDPSIVGDEWTRSSLVGHGDTYHGTSCHGERWVFVVMTFPSPVP